MSSHSKKLRKAKLSKKVTIPSFLYDKNNIKLEMLCYACGVTAERMTEIKGKFFKM